MLGTQTAGVARDIDSHVATAHHDGAAGQRVDLATVDLAKEVNGYGHILGILARNAGKAATLAADGNIKGLKALRAQLVKRHVATDFHAIADSAPIRRMISTSASITSFCSLKLGMP